MIHADQLLARGASAWSTADTASPAADTKGTAAGDRGMKRCIGLGVIADNIINIGNAMARQTET
jgi:hypothetical protein